MAEKEKGQLGLETELCVGIGVKSVTEKRVVKLTPKALLEKISTLEKERKSKFSKMSNAKISIAKLMGDKKHVSEVENEFNMFIKLGEEIQHVHTSLLGFLPADEANKHEIWYQAKMLSFNEFFEGTNQWLTDIKATVTKMDYDHDDLPVQIETQTVDVNAENGNEVDVSNGRTAGGEDEEAEDQIQPQDSISNVQSRHRGSSNGSSSSRSSTSSVRRRARAEQAALLARAAALKDKHALEEQELILRRKKEQLELDIEIAATSAKLAVLQGGSSVHSRQSDGMASYIRKGARSKLQPTSLNPQASIFVPPPSQRHAFLPLQSNASPLATPTILPKPTVIQGFQPPQLQSKTTFSQSFQPTVGQQVFQPLQGQHQTTGIYNLLQQQ